MLIIYQCQQLVLYNPQLISARRCDPWGRQCDQLYLVVTKFSCLVASLAPKIGNFLLWENVH